MKLSAPDWCFYRPPMDAADYYARVRAAGVGAVEMVPPERIRAAKAAGLVVLNFERDLADQIARIAHVHLADLPKRGCPASDERIPFRSLVRTAARAGYSGYFGLEFIPSGDPLGDLQRAVAHVAS